MLINLGFEWFIEGDDNRNATVEVQIERRDKRRGNPRYPCSGYTAKRSTTASNWMSCLRTCLREAFWIWSRTPNTNAPLICPILMVGRPRGSPSDEN